MRYAAPADVLTIVKQLLNIPSDQRQQRGQYLAAMLEPAENGILSSAGREMIDRAADIIKMLDVPGGAESRMPMSNWSFEVYPITSVDPALAMSSCRRCFGPSRRQTDRTPRPGSTIVWYSPTHGTRHHSRHARSNAARGTKDRCHSAPCGRSGKAVGGDQ